MRLEVRDILNEIFLPVAETPWERIPMGPIIYLGMHRATLIFYSKKHDALAALLWRKEPSDDCFIGNFPCSRKLLEWLPDQIRTASEDTTRGVRRAYLATIENAKQNEILSFAEASEVRARTIGRRTPPFISSVSGNEFYWLDRDLFPIDLYSKHRSFREMRTLPDFLKPRDKGAASQTPGLGQG